jgi:hypothetical protein
MTDRVAAMDDHAQVVDLVHRYCDAVTRMDVERLAGTWAEHANWDIGKGRHAEGRDAIVALYQRATSALRIVVQLVYNGEAAVDAEAGTGTGRWYVSEQLERMTGARGALYAWYDDTYVREDGAWKFASRIMTVLYHGAPDLSDAFTPPG